MVGLIPRVRVNYNLLDLIKALLAGRGIGRKYEQLRQTICAYFCIDDILLTSSGRSSIYMLLRYLPQSKVIVPAYTCKVVVEAALMAGKNIIYAPTSSKTFNISSLPDVDSDSIVIATHQYGLPCDIDRICDKCKKSGAIVIEDCAASLGTKINGKLTGLFGDFSIFSFDSSKMINVPSKGGFIIAKDVRLLKEIHQKTPTVSCSIMYKMKHLVRGGIYVALRSKHLYKIFHYITMGRNGKMQLDDHSGLDTTLGEFYTHGFYEWQAVIALRQFRQLDKYIAKRHQVYSYYSENIINPKIKRPIYEKEAACIRYALLVENKKEFYEECIKHGVDMGFSFNSIACPSEWTEEHMISDEILNLPYYYNLSEGEKKHIVQTINAIKSW